MHHLKKILFTTVWLACTYFAGAQEVTGIHAEIRAMGKETDPHKVQETKDRLIREYKLDTLQDTETLDLLNGQVAVAFAREKNYAAFEHYIGLIKNKFNKTSILSMAANELLDKDIDATYAHKLAKLTLEKYAVYKDDPSARPAGFTKEDWDRFMSFAQFPYYDTYAKALMAVKDYEDALHYQLKAFDGKPEDGLPSSVERYAKLLALNGDIEESKKLLLKVAGKGKLNKGMVEQLRSFYVKEGRRPEHFNLYIDSLQQGIQAAMINEMRANMLNMAAPSFTLKNLEGKQVSLADYKGKIVILDLWATWCVPCIASFPAMQQQVNKHKDVVFLFIAVDEKGKNIHERVKKFITKNNYSFHVLLDEPVSPASDQFVITSAYKPNGIPAKYFIDREGTLRFKTAGFDTDAELVNEIDAIITILKTL